MNCLSCTQENPQKAREAALELLRTPGKLSQEETDKAIACCQCYSDMMADEANKRMNA